MISTAIKGVFAHKLRLALTALAIILGVAFVSGTYVFTDTINARFDNLFTDVYAGVDATVRAERNDLGAVDRTRLERVADLGGVVFAEAGVEAENGVQRGGLRLA